MGAGEFERSPQHSYGSTAPGSQGQPEEAKSEMNTCDQSLTIVSLIHPFSSPTISQNGMFSRSMVFSPYNQNWRELNLDFGRASSSSMGTQGEDIADPPPTSAHVWTDLQSWRGIPGAKDLDGEESSLGWRSPDHLRMRLTDEVQRDGGIWSHDEPTH